MHHNLQTLMKVAIYFLRSSSSQVKLLYRLITALPVLMNAQQVVLQTLFFVEIFLGGLDFTCSELTCPK